MIVELDRDPTLYPDGNIVEVTLLSVLLPLVLMICSSGLAPLAIKTLHWTASPSVEQETHLQRLE